MRRRRSNSRLPHSLYESISRSLYNELTAQPSPDPPSYEELVNMMHVPFHLEKFMALGWLVCFNAFLTLLTLVPLRVCVACWTVWRTRSLRALRVAQRDVLTVVSILAAVALLSAPRLDVSRMYHDVRGSPHIKLYVMFGVLEMADKLCSSIGQDVLGVFHATHATREPVKFGVFACLSVFYLSFHAYILIYQTVSLHVAANAYSNALMALLLSNQFSELKGSVFKRFDREGLFQLTMADLAERFQLSLMLGVIGVRNLVQLHASQGLVPNSWQSWSWPGAALGPAVVVIGSEVFVDWLKHCYIAKFNKFRPRVYKNFTLVVAMDCSRGTDYVAATRRIGLPLAATTVCVLRMTCGDVSWGWAALPLFPLLLLGRLLLGHFLEGLSRRAQDKQEKTREKSEMEKTRENQEKTRETEKTGDRETQEKARDRETQEKTGEKECEMEKTGDRETQEKTRDESEMEKTGDRESQEKTGDEKKEKEFQDEINAGLVSSLNHSGHLTPSSQSLKIPESSNSLSSHSTTQLKSLEDHSSHSITQLKSLESLNTSHSITHFPSMPPRRPSRSRRSSPRRSSPARRYSVDQFFFPGAPNTAMSSISADARRYLYEGEDVPEGPEEKRNRSLKSSEKLVGVMRYEMASKRIW